MVDDRPLFAGVSFGITSGDKVAIVGPNGAGKSTLLKIIAQQLTPTTGTVIHRNGLRIGMLTQHSPDVAIAAHPYIMQQNPGLRDDEADALLSRLNIAADLQLADASGGERRRVDLAALLALPHDLLILDEPTNHLDIDTINWLEQRLASHAGALVLVTHDRYVLERLTTRMLDISPTSAITPADVMWHEGNYSSLLFARLERDDAKAQQTRRAQNLLRKEVAWLRRQPQARASKPKFRREQVDVLREQASTDADDQPLELGTGRRRLGNDVFRLENVALRFGDTTILHDVNVTIGPGERVGIVGANGAGKTSLLRLLTGEHEPTTGTIKRGHTVVAGIYTQQLPAVDERVAVIDTITAIAPHVPLANGETLPANRLAERFGFNPQQQRTPVARLSGGERRRLALLHLLIDAPNVILLDEPTNDLDLDTLAVLEDYLDGFTGTLICATHDRYVLERLTDRVLVVANTTVSETGQAEPLDETRRSMDLPSTGRSSRNDNQRRQQQRRELRQIEQRLERLQRDQKKLEAAMAANSTEAETLAALSQQHAQTCTDIADVEEQWLMLADELDVV
ncbi:MAG: ABC-F family ATP-binding cassette domain-containing protein [Nitriliruptoraceae bacterium]